MEDAKRAMLQALPQLKRLVKEAERVDEEVVPDNPEDQMICNELVAAGNLIGDAVAKLEYLQRSIIEEGTLQRNTRGRYEVGEYGELTSGHPIEALLNDGYEKRWVVSRIEHNGDDYYLHDAPSMALEGVPVRIRRLSV